MTHITLPRAVVEQALEALENWRVSDAYPLVGKKHAEAITAIRAALNEASKEVEPSKDQLTQILNGLDRCHEAGSKREFLRTWIRDFVQHKTHPAPAVPEGWLRAVDEALVTAHLGVADAGDSYEDAKKKLDALIDWSIQVAIDPAVNGGFVLVPKEPTKKMIAAAISSKFGVESEYKAMLAAAGEYK